MKNLKSTLENLAASYPTFPKYRIVIGIGYLVVLVMWLFDSLSMEIMMYACIIILGGSFLYSRYWGIFSFIMMIIFFTAYMLFRIVYM